jgi:hypothetical protein
MHINTYHKIECCCNTWILERDQGWRNSQLAHMPYTDGGHQGLAKFTNANIMKCVWLYELISWCGNRLAKSTYTYAMCCMIL